MMEIIHDRKEHLVYLTMQYTNELRSNLNKLKIAKRKYTMIEAEIRLQERKFIEEIWETIK